MKWRAIRKRLMPVAFLAALALLATRTCASESASAQIQFAVGDAPVTELRADLYRGESDEGLGYFESKLVQDGIAGTWSLTADPGTYRLAIEARTPHAVERIERTVQIRDRAVITVDLERDLL